MPVVKLFLLMFALEIAVAILVVGLLAIFFKIKANRRSTMRDEILQKRRSSFGNAIWIPIRYSSREYFQKICKYFVWEKSGVLFLDRGSFFFVSDAQIDQSLVFNHNSSEASLNWVGLKFWPNGFVYWFSMVSDGETHYFTSETGALTFASRKTTESVYNRLREYVAQEKNA